VVSFDSNLPGTPAEVWAADPRLAELPALDLGVGDRVIVVAAHPDDETLGAGGLIAECSLQGIPVQVVVVTDGAASHPTSPDLSGTALAARREQEAREAIEILAPGSAVVFLGFADGAVRENSEPIYDALAALLENAPGTTVLVAPWRGDGHRDHRVVGEVTASLAAAAGIRLLEYPIWMWHWSTPDNAVTPWGAFASLALRPQALAAKRRAITAYESQIAPIPAAASDDTILHPRFLRNFGRTMEVFVTRATLPPAPAVGTGVTAASPTTLAPAPTPAKPVATSGDEKPEARDIPAPTGALTGDYFDAAYERRDDPWGFETRWYENRKRALTLACLPAERYESALEIGCSIGVLTEQLAARCAALLAVDISQAAVDRARRRLTTASHVSIERMDVGRRFPERHFDLVVLSEVGYYFDLETLGRVLDKIEDSLGSTGTLVVCHWRHDVEDYPLSGDEVHNAVRQRESLHRIAVHVEADFLLEVFSHDGRSVAQRTGLA
jgi:LmbE family N-acetylglucosaminyl deacetylase/SAM-dependent methyltransferase